MNARTRTARATIKARATQARAAARIQRRGTASLTTHAIAAGLTPAEARTVASSLRRNTAKLGLTGTAHRVHAGRRMRTTHRFTPAQVALAAAAYRPRKPEFKAASARLALAA
ncbi:hypothetical protein ACIQGZ_17430 [Streptomyces sp. NPDC092296]|uniref:hypothetical protein n=1 Tax=Streptomyces sp. NPDC092296 TaxID=3366012 RepID=UPI003814EEA2